jgi:predicted nucleotidyltransferase
MAQRKIVNMIQEDEPNLLYLVLDGSRAHGTFTPESDYDYRGVFANTRDVIYGFNKRESVSYKLEDIALHSLHKFISLALNSNPNIFELLFMDDMIKVIHPLFNEYFLVHRDKLITQRSGKAYAGFARSQMIRNSNRAGHGQIRPQYKYGPKDDAYDSKYAMHTIRMLINGIEMMTKGTLTTKFSGRDLDLLINIRAGKEFKNGTEFESHAKALDDILQKEMVQVALNKRLPENADKNFFSEQMVDFYEEYYHDLIITEDK